MKVLGLISGSEGYGVRRAWLGLSAQFRKKEVDLFFVSVNEGGLSQELREKNFEVMTLLDKEFKNVKAGNLKFFYLFYRFFLQLIIIPKIILNLKRNKIDVILFRSPMEVMLMGVISKLTGIKSFWLMPNSVSSNYPFDLNRRIYRFIFKYCNVVPIANSEYTLSTLGNGAKGYYTHLGVDPEIFIYSEISRDKIRSKLNLTKNDILIGIFARMTPEKGQSMMIDAIQALGDEAKNVNLLLLGSGNNSNYKKEIENKIKNYGLSDRIHLVGAVDNVVDYYSACDIVANTRLDAEPFGFSVIEAMMMGIPVLAHKLGGPGETVIDGLTGWHIMEPTVTSFSLGVRRVLKDQYFFKEICENSFRYSHQKFTSENMANNILEIFNKEDHN